MSCPSSQPSHENSSHLQPQPALSTYLSPHFPTQAFMFPMLIITDGVWNRGNIIYVPLQKWIPLSQTQLHCPCNFQSKQVPFSNLPLTVACSNNFCGIPYPVRLVYSLRRYRNCPYAVTSVMIFRSVTYHCIRNRLQSHLLELHIFSTNSGISGLQICRTT